MSETTLMSRVPYVSSEPLLTDAKFQYDTPNSISMLQSRPPKKLVRPGLAQETNKTVASSSRSSGRSYLTASLHAATHSVGSSGELELREILENATCGTPTTTFLGVSPPNREGCFGGAANPLAHDSSWQCSAYSVCHNHLEALRELDSRGNPFLRSASVGDMRLILGSPEISSVPESIKWPQEGQPGAKGVPFTCTTRYFAV